MTREDQIQHATAVYQAKLLGQGYTSLAVDNCADSFYEGAVWADANPQWHKCSEDLPEPNVPVLCYTEKGTYFVAWRKEIILGGNTPSGKYEWSRWNCPIIAWTELPQPPKFD